MPAHSHRAARLAAVPGELFELGDPAFALDPGRVARRERCDQALNPVAHPQGEMGGDGARQRTDVLRGHVGGSPEQPRVLGLAHPRPPIFASSARASISACCPTSMASWSPITQTWL